jgi:hypothetical protein
MNVNASLAQDISVLQLALGGQTPIEALPLSPATLLSLVRSQIDLLIEQQITATLWVKLPPGNIWHLELNRLDGVVYNCQVGELTPKNSASNHLDVQFAPDSQLRREYFFMVLSPQFCSLIVTRRSLRVSSSETLKKSKSHRKRTLLSITTFDSRVIQQVLDTIQKCFTPFPDFICASAPDPALINQLLTKQLCRQQEINRQINQRRINRVEKQKQKLYSNLELKDDYLSNVCQELRIPLTHMKTALSLLNSPNLKPPQRQRYFQMLNTQCDRQNSLIAGLLDLVELERNLEGTTLESVRLSDIVPGVVSTYQPLAQEKGIMLAYTVPTELPPVWCVSGGLRQIAINLLHNSIKFTANGGEVWVRGRIHENYVQLEFRDTGIGIADSEITKIFDRFYRVRPLVTEDVSGAGLGLTIVQHLLWRCGGSISVKSKPSEGSTFIVQLATVTEESLS